MTDSERGPYPLDQPEVSVGELVARLTEDFGAIVQSHIKLAKEEITAELKKAGRGAGMLGGGAMAGWIAALLLSFALAWGLAELFDEQWLGFFVVGLLWTVAAAWLFSTGRRQLQDVEAKPEQTIEELKEDKRWLTEQKN
jgi:Putative Actinobacterial Holin-X, holin superfamily III